MSRRALVAVCGAGTLRPSDPRYLLAKDLGRALARDYDVLCGGRGGVMEAVAQGVRHTPPPRGRVIGLLPDDRPGSPALDIALRTGLGHLRNGLIVQADAVVAIGGGAGTLSELALAWALDRPVIAFRVEGWSGRLADTRIDTRVRPGLSAPDQVWGVDSVAEAIDRLGLLLA